MPQDMTPMVHENWVWVITSLFGVIIGFGFQRLEETLSSSWEQSKRCFTGHLFVGLVFSIFLVYDVTVYSLFIKKLPYTTSALGGIRFVLDLVMAFGMYVLVRRGMGMTVWERFRELLIGLTIWHTAAILWHVVAHAERSQFAPMLLVGPHVGFMALYWAIFVTKKYMTKKTPEKEHYFNRVFVLTLAICVLLVAVSRTAQIVITYKP